MICSFKKIRMGLCAVSFKIPRVESKWAILRTIFEQFCGQFHGQFVRQFLAYLRQFWGQFQGQFLWTIYVGILLTFTVIEWLKYSMICRFLVIRDWIMGTLSVTIVHVKSEWPILRTICEQLFGQFHGQFVGQFLDYLRQFWGQFQGQ